MNPLRVLSVVALLAAAVLAAPNQHSQQSMNGNLKPSQWLSPSELEQTPSVDEVSVERLENMPLEKGAKLLEKMYHVAQINHDLRPSFVPSASSVPVYFFKRNGQKETTTLDKFASVARQQPEFGSEEVTIFITGLPAETESIKKANRKLVHAYMQRYNMQRQKPQSMGFEQQDSSKEDSAEWNNAKETTGNLVIIDLAERLNNFKRYAMLDIENCGAMIGDQLVKLTEKANVPHEIIHIVAQNIAAHVAGAAGNEYTRQTGHQLRRITALDPSKLFAKDPEQLTGLSRGDAEFVDAIHTSAYGMGTPQRVGDIDFFPNGPSAGVPGAENVIEACMRATRYFAESVRPGNERNFPAVQATSLREYMNNNGFGKRVFMGIDCDFDIEGDYILEVNEKSPFGKRTPAQKQNTYHGIHKSWKNAQDNE